MAGLRSGRPACIRAAFASTRAGFQKRWRNTPRRFKANHKKNHMELIEGIWRETMLLAIFIPCFGDSVTALTVHRRNELSREVFTTQFLDPYDGQSSVYSLSTCCPGDVTCIVPSHTPTSRSPGEVRVEDPLASKIPDCLLKAASWGPASPEADDVDMWPVEASGPEAPGWPAGPSGAPEDRRMTDEGWPRAAGPLLPAAEPSEPGRHTQGRTRGSRPPPRLGSEKDKGPKLILFKRKLELLLAEPEKRKRKKQYVA